MFKSLKRRFMIINMSLLFCVLLAIFTGVYFLMYKSSETQSLMYMESIAKSDGSSFKQKPQFESGNERRKAPPPPFDNPIAKNSFSIKIDSNGNIIDIVSELPLDDYKESLLPAVSSALKEDTGRGKININGLSLRFLIANKPYGKIIVFLDRTIEISTLNNLIVTTLIIGSLSFIVLFIISLYLASWAIKPVKYAWEKQKEFVADASHELKTPLTVIATNADVVLANPQDKVINQAKWINYIKVETDRMSKLVNNLLYLAKVDNNEEKDSFLSFNLSDAIISASLPFESVIFESNKTFEINVEPDIYLYGDEEKIKQIAVILLDNAIKNSNDNGKIGLGLNVDKDKNKVNLTVSNTGYGIPPESIDKIFERFYRVDKSRTRETGGYGLGLSIAKTIVDHHKGSINVKSIINDTTTFMVLLPIK